MKLAELQDRFGRALLHGNDSALAGLLRNDGIHPDSLLRIYRDSAFASLTSVLSGVFAAVRWLLGDETFRRTAEGFIRAYPPTQPCLDEYGERFAEFLVQFDASRQRPYLPDLAQLEWLVRRAEQAPELVPLSAAAFRRAIREDPTTLLVRLNPSTEVAVSGGHHLVCKSSQERDTGSRARPTEHLYRSTMSRRVCEPPEAR